MLKIVTAGTGGHSAGTVAKSTFYGLACDLRDY